MWVGGLKEHEGHAGAEKNDVGGFVNSQEFAFEVPSVREPRNPCMLTLC